MFRFGCVPPAYGCRTQIAEVPVFHNYRFSGFYQGILRLLETDQVSIAAWTI